jgi:hypothetical protein
MLLASTSTAAVSMNDARSQPPWQACLPNLLVDSKANGEDLTFVLTASISKQVTGRNPFIWVVL